MHLVTRLTLLLAAAAVPLHAELQSEYKQADTQYYLGGDLFRADPAACIVTPDDVTNMGDSYLISTRPHAPRVIYLQQTHDWLEPITPPDMPASLNCPSSQMQVREPQGSVQVALPSAPASFIDVRSGMEIPNGSVLRTGDASSVAVLFGGVDSVRLAPNTRAAVQMNLVGGVRDVEVDTRGGMVFSKVGQRVGEREVYAVHTPFGIASAHGTDYVTVVLPGRIDVWVAQGTVELAAPDGGNQVTASTGHEPLKVMRYPVAPTPAVANAESAESLTALLNFIPMANQKIKALVDRSHGGGRLTPTEKAYMARIRQVTSLIKLATAETPATPAPSPEPVLPVAKVAPPPVKPAAPAVVEIAYPRAKPVVLPSGSAPTAGKPVAGIPSTLAPSAHKPPASQVATTASKPGAAAPTKTTKLAQSTKKAKHPKQVAAADTSLDRLAPPPDENYPRAKPVNAADLVAAPTVMDTPPARASAVPVAPAIPVAPAASTDGADPNSLGAQLNPFHDGGTPPAPLKPRFSGTDLGGVAGKGGNTAP
jgi:hypothetical protein